jgi:heat shock protein HslJ
LVKEKLEVDWTMFYDQIQDFAYEEGFLYELRVRQEKVENPPADASANRWVLVEVVSQTRTLEGTTWEMKSYVDDKGETVPALPDSQVTARFQAGQVGGNAGCNSYFGTYQLDGAKMEVQLGGATAMFCAPQELMDQETRYLAALGSAAFHLVAGDELRIADASGATVLTYGVLQPTRLVGTEWQLTGYNNGKGGFSSALAGTTITALFAEDGRMTGSAGCNTYTAAYQASGSSISIGPEATTRMMCAQPEGIMEQETAYLAALQRASSFRIEGTGLELADAQGTRMAAFVAAVSAPDRGPAQAGGLSQEELANMEYKSDWTQSGVAPLSNGQYSEPAAPGSATEIAVALTEWVAYGLLNGQEAAAVILVTNPGGSGTFYDLAVVVEQDGQPVNVATTLLGDRVTINALAIEDNQVVVDMITQGPEDPMCCPTQRAVQTYALEGDQLVQTSSTVVAPAAGEPQTLTGVVWKWEQFLESNDETLVVDDPSRYTLEFLPDGQVSILADCNQVRGSYTTDGSQLSIQLGPSTLMACPPGSLDSQYLQYLGEVVSYVFDGDKLALALRYDTGIMTFIGGD